MLEKTRLADFLRAENGLDTRLAENAANLSGGQKQRLSLARALLHDSAAYIFDEATSNIDAESENDITASSGDDGTHADGGAEIRRAVLQPFYSVQTARDNQKSRFQSAPQALSR